MSRLEVKGVVALPCDLIPCCPPPHMLPHAGILQFDLNRPDFTEKKMLVEKLMI